MRLARNFPQRVIGAISTSTRRFCASPAGVAFEATGCDGPKPSVEIRRIGRGRDLAGEIEVLSGLTAGEQIVVDGAFLLKAQAEKGEVDEHAH